MRLANDFGEYNQIVIDYIKKLYTNSLDLYKKRYQETRKTGTQELDEKRIKESMTYVVDYLYYYYKFYKNDFFHIFNTIINDLKFVTVLPPRERGLYGKYESREKCIYINPELSSSINLNSNERIRLYINHELGHIINDKWMNNVIKYLNITPTAQTVNKQLFYDGFSLLDESITQNKAEDITYFYIKKTRPKMKTKYGRLFNGQGYKTNYDYYGELQTPTITFARTLQGLDNNFISDDDVLTELCRRALNPNFSTSIIEEYKKTGRLTDLYEIFQHLGKIKNASYAAFGMGNRRYLDESATVLEEYNKLARNLRFSQVLKSKKIR